MGGKKKYINIFGSFTEPSFLIRILDGLCSHQVPHIVPVNGTTCTDGCKKCDQTLTMCIRLLVSSSLVDNTWSTLTQLTDHYLA